MLLFDFSTPSDAWRIVNDGVMGGLSKGTFEIDGGLLKFTGNLVTQGGGFTSVAAPKQVDLSGYDGIEMRVRGGGRTFELNVDDGTRRLFRPVSRRGAFPTTPDWATIRVPFDSLKTSVYGQPVRARAIDPAKIQNLGLFILDNQDGPFRLEVDWIRAYRAGD